MKKSYKSGVALIMTISLVTGLCAFGIAFLSLLQKDQAQTRIHNDRWLGELALETAFSAGLWEIDKQVKDFSYNYNGAVPSPLDSTYIGSTITRSSSGYNNAWFENEITLTNSRINIYQSGPELYNLLKKLGKNTSFDGTTPQAIKDLVEILSTHSSSWAFSHPSELTKASPKFTTEHYAEIHPLLTSKPNTQEELEVNLIDYGSCGISAISTLVATNRDFAPLGTTSPKDEYLKGAWVEILSGPGMGETRMVSSITSSTTLKITPNWTTTPTTDSTYRLYSYVSPININGADLKVIQANLEILDDYQDQLCVLTNTLSSTLMDKIKDYRKKTILMTPKDTSYPASPIGKHGETTENFYKFLKDCSVSSSDHQEKIWKMFDPKQPKAIEDGGTWKIYPLPLPFAFTHDGYFDMKIKSGMTRGTSQKPKYTVNNYFTIKRHQRKAQRLRKDFKVTSAGGGGHQNWVTINPMVPVRNMADQANWAPITAASFAPYSQTDSFNVIPDGIKTGLWFDFTQLDGAQTNDLIYDQVTKSYVNIDKLYDSTNFLFTSEQGQISKTGPVGQLTISGTTNPQSKIYLGPSPSAPKGSTDDEKNLAYSQYTFGEIGIATQIEDNDTSIINLKHFPHNAAYSNTSYYTTVPSDATAFESHTYSDHLSKTCSYDNESVPIYPARRYFTPALSVSDNRGTTITIPAASAETSLSYRTEYVYPTTAFPCDDSLTGCIADAELTSTTNYSVTKESGFHDPAGREKLTGSTPSNITTNFKLFTTLQNNSGFFFDATFDDQGGGAGDQSITDQSFSGSFFSNGRLSFLREWTSNFDYFGSHRGAFNVKYLRLIPGKRNDFKSTNLKLTNFGEATHPFYLSPKLQIPTEDGAYQYRKMRVYYQLGYRLTPGVLSSADHVKIGVKLEFNKNPSNAASFQENNLSVSEQLDIDTDSKMSGYFDLEIKEKDNSGFLSITSIDEHYYRYKLTISNDGTSTGSKKAFLNTTFAITGIEVFYDCKNQIVVHSTQP